MILKGHLCFVCFKSFNYLKGWVTERTPNYWLNPQMATTASSRPYWKSRMWELQLVPQCGWQGPHSEFTFCYFPQKVKRHSEWKKSNQDLNQHAYGMLVSMSCHFFSQNFHSGYRAKAKLYKTMREKSSGFVIKQKWLYFRSCAQLHSTMVCYCYLMTPKVSTIHLSLSFNLTCN